MTLTTSLSILPTKDIEIWSAYSCNFGFWNQFPVMLIGISLYKFSESIDLESIIKHKVAFSLTTVTGCFLLLYGFICKGTNISIWPFTYFTTWGLVFAIWFISQQAYSLRIINNPITRILGKYSYAIYLFHYLIIMNYGYLRLSTGNIRTDSILKICVVTILSLIVGIITTKIIETPFISLMNNILLKSPLNR